MLEPVGVMVGGSGLEWFGRVERRDGNDWVRRCITREDGELDRRAPGGRSWWDCVESDLKVWVCPMGCAVQELVEKDN